jgi:hypothetical protein
MAPCDAQQILLFPASPTVSLSPSSPFPPPASDDNPENNFETLRFLIEGLGYRMPTIRLPLAVMYYIAFVIEILHAVIGPIYNFQPFLTRAEVFKSGVTHFFRMDKAKTLLGYKPHAYPRDDILAWFIERGHGKIGKKGAATRHKALLLLLGMVLAALLASFIMHIGM